MKKRLALTDKVEIGRDVVIDNGNIKEEAQADLVAGFFLTSVQLLDPEAVARARGNNKVVEEVVVGELGVERDRAKNGVDMGTAELNAVVDVAGLDGTSDGIVVVKVEASDLPALKELKPVAFFGAREADTLQPVDKLGGLGQVVAHSGRVGKRFGKAGTKNGGTFADGGNLGWHSARRNVM